MRVLLGTLVGAAYLAVWIHFDRLRFPVSKDEFHFWPTTILFSRTWLPGLTLLKGYPELNTPLPFLIWGWLEQAFHAGIAAGRSLNLALSLAMTLLVLRGPLSLCGVGLLLFPYYLGTSVYLYTDILAAFFALTGMALHLRRRFLWSGLAFALAVSCRQFAVAFPLGALAWESFSGRRQRAALLSTALAASTLLGWFLFFGDLAPAAELRSENLDVAAWYVIHPSYSLFFLAVVGLYFVVPELALLGGARRMWEGRSKRDAAAVLLLFAAFLAFAPVNQEPFPTFGYTDAALRCILADPLRMALYFGLAALAVTRCLRAPLAFWLAAANAAVLCKAHTAWEKYAVPCLAVLWYLRSRDLLKPGR